MLKEFLPNADEMILEYVEGIIQDENNTIDEIIEIIISFELEMSCDLYDFITHSRSVSKMVMDDVMEIHLGEETKVLESLLKECHIEKKGRHEVKVQEKPLDVGSGFLVGMAPHVDDKILHYLLHVKAGGSEEKAVQLFLDMENLESLKEQAQLHWKQERETECAEKEKSLRIKKQLMDRYAERETTGQISLDEKKHRHVKSGDSQVRYYNGQIVSRRGEKFIAVEKQEEWDGGSRGKVKSKGKRGIGWSS